MAVHPIQNHGKNGHSFRWKESLRHWLMWSLLVAALFYGLHCYFEYRSGELDRRMEQLRGI